MDLRSSDLGSVSSDLGKSESMTIYIEIPFQSTLNLASLESVLTLVTETVLKLWDNRDAGMEDRTGLEKVCPVN